MAKAETVVLSVRIPPEMLARVDSAGARAEVVAAALRAYFDPPPVGANPVQAAIDAGARFHEEIEDLKRQLAASRVRSIVGKPAVKASQPPGDVRAAAAVTVPTDVGFRPFPVGSLAKGSKKKGAGNGQAYASEGREAD